MFKIYLPKFLPSFVKCEKLINYTRTKSLIMY